MGVAQCPRCGAHTEMESVTVGRLKDKKVRCGYCSTLMPDQLMQGQAMSETGTMPGQDFDDVPDFLFQETRDRSVAAEEDPQLASGTLPEGADVDALLAKAEKAAEEMVSQALGKEGAESKTRRPKKVSSEPVERVVSPVAPGWAGARPERTEPVKEVPQNQQLLRLGGLMLLSIFAFIGLLSLLR